MRVFLLSAVMALTCACGGQLKGDNFMYSVRGFNEDLRWQRFPGAASKIPPRQRVSFLDEREALEDDLRIDDWEIKRVRWGKDRVRAAVHIKYTWHSDRRGLVRSTTAVQHWEQHGKRWFMAEERRLRGDDMPGLLDRGEKKKKKKLEKRTARSEADTATKETLRKNKSMPESDSLDDTEK